MIGAGVGVWAGMAGVTASPPSWMQFDGLAWLERGGELTGAPASTQAITFAATYRMGAGDVGVAKTLFATENATGFFIKVVKLATDKMRIRFEDTGDVLTHNMNPAGVLVAGVDYLILVSLDAVTNGSNVVVINLSDGSILTSGSGATVGTTHTAAGMLDWLIAASSGAGADAIDGRMERVMLWPSTYADVSLTATQRFFVQADGTLEMPAVAVSALGATPIVNISGISLASGANAGSGGSFIKDGAGSITAI